MRFKKLTSAAIAATLAATCITTSQVVFAETSFSSPSEFITDVVTTAIVDIVSATKDDAIATMQSKLTTSGDAVLYDGNTIGYWYADDSTTLYADDTKTDTLFKKTATGYETDPTLLGTLLSDINDNLVDTYVPTTEDWSKIIGKYDVTLGDITIPANQWVQAEATTDCDPLLNGKSVNISRLSGIDASSALLGNYTSTSMYICSWLVDNAGKLYLQNQLLNVNISPAMEDYWYHQTDTLDSNEVTTGGRFYQVPKLDSVSTGSGSTMYKSVAPLIKAGLISSGTGLYARVYNVNATHTSVVCNGSGSALSATSAKLCCVDDPAIINTCLLEDAKAYGVVYFTGGQAPLISNDATFNSQHDRMFEINSATRRVMKNANLTKRLLKLTALDSSDVLTITPTDWRVNNTESIDQYMASQNMLAAGETADINAVAEIEPLSFNVVLPTTLPIYVATDGTVSTATNATVNNKSNAAVRITDVTITAKPTCGWTLVDDNPSDVRDAREFTFETSLAANQVLQRNEILPFTYSAELSPMTSGEDNLDLATVSVTVDWAD